MHTSVVEDKEIERCSQDLIRCSQVSNLRDQCSGLLETVTAVGVCKVHIQNGSKWLFQYHHFTGRYVMSGLHDVSLTVTTQ